MRDILRLEGVYKSYTRGERRIRVLRGVSLVVRAQEIVAVVGSRYDGKTTLLRVAAGLEQPDEGAVCFEDLELSRAPERRRARLLGSRIAWVHGGGSAVQLKVLDYVALPLAIGRRRGRREARELARAALERVGAADCAGQSWSDLSNWERVLVALARGIVAGPSLLVIDDLLDGLGMRRTQEASELLRGLTAELGCATLMSACDVEGALEADRVFALDRGKLSLISDQSYDEGHVIDFPTRVPDPRGATGAGA